MIVRYDRMMNDFEGLMKEILTFIEFEPTNELLETIKKTSDKQKSRKSEHKYSLAQFGLNEERIRKDYAQIYKTFFSENVEIII
jgi:hypothetical protein